MAQKNYQAWHIDPSDFSNDLSHNDKLLFFARYAILAPSGHNTQPWKLLPTEDGLAVHINRSHYLPIDGSGLVSVEPYVSVGTFLETFILAAAGFGYAVKLDVSLHDDKVATLHLAGKLPPKPELLAAITSRVSNRKPFDKKPLDATTLKKLIGTDLTGVGTTLVTQRADIDFIATQTESAITTIMSNPEYRAELSKWVRPNQTRKYDGMPGFTHGFGSLKSLVSKAAVKHAKKQGPQAKHSAELIQQSGALVIVRCRDNSHQTFVNTGRLYARMCVHATKAGLASSALGAAVLDGDSREKVKKHFKITDRPIFILRLGKATAPAAHSPRWPIEKLLG